MPQMPRLNKKTTKIAYDILGTPANIKSYEDKKKNKKENKIDERLIFEETTRVR